MFWTVRPMPRRTIWCVFAPEMVSPWNTTVPLVGASAPVTTLNSVVLPEPFGPMSAKIEPRGTSKLTASSARRPPKFFVRLRIDRIASRELMAPAPDAPRVEAGTTTSP